MANPHLIIAGLALTVASAAIGIFAVPGWIDAAHDAAAVRDITSITQAQIVSNDVHGRYFGDLSESTTNEWGVQVTMSEGVELLELDGGEGGWCAAVQSQTGNVFAASHATEHYEASDNADDVVVQACPMVDPVGVPAVTVTQTDTSVYATAAAIVCGRGEPNYSLRHRAGQASWSSYSEWSETDLSTPELEIVDAAYSFQAQARCATGIQASAVVQSPVVEHSTTVPSPTSVPELTVTESGDTVTATISEATCELGVPQYRMRAATPSTSSAPWTRWSATERTIAAAVGNEAWVQFLAEARCAAGSQSSAAVAPEAVTFSTKIAPPAAPTLTLEERGEQVTVTAAPAVCQAGATPEYRMQTLIQSAGFSPYTEWSAVREHTVGLVPNTSMWFYVQTRCASSPTRFSTELVQNSIALYTTIQAPTGQIAMKPVIVEEGNILGEVSVASCLSGGTPEYRLRHRMSLTTAAGVWGEYTVWGAGRTMSVAGAAGSKHGFQAEVRCVASMGRISPVKATAEVTFTVPLPAPAAPVLTYATSGNATTWTASAVCPTGSTPRYVYRDFGAGMTVRWTAWTTSPTTINTRTLNTGIAGFDYMVQMRAQCSGATGTSPWSEDSETPMFTRPLPAPAAPSFTFTRGERSTVYWGALACSTGSQFQARSAHWYQVRKPGESVDTHSGTAAWSSLDGDQTAAMGEWEKVDPDAPDRFDMGWTNNLNQFIFPVKAHEMRVAVQTRCYNAVSGATAENAPVFSPVFTHAW